MAIKSFADKATEAIFFQEQGDTRARNRLPVDLWEKTHEIFDALDGAEILNELRVYDLSSMKADREGEYSLRINDQYRVCFEWDDGDVERVEVVDYH